MLYEVITLSEYADKHYIHAIGGGWLGSSKDIASKNYSKITDITKTSIDVLLGFEIAHIGINSTDKEKALTLAKELDFIFSFGLKEGKSSNFVGSVITSYSIHYTKLYEAIAVTFIVEATGAAFTWPCRTWMSTKVA